MKKSYWLLTICFLFTVVVSVPVFSKDLSISSAFQKKEKPGFLSNHADNSDRLDYVQRLDNELTEISHDDQNRRYAEVGQEEIFKDPFADEEIFEEQEIIADPFESVNRVFFGFNDRLYFWVLKPVAKGYATVVPERVRISLRHFFDNFSTPIRIVNNLLQMKFRPAGNELLRFSINSTVGVLGFFDIARQEMGIQMQDEDFGQTLGTWGMGPGFYINWPFLGPSSLRDSVGDAGDYFLDPVNYVTPLIDQYAIKIGDQVNRTSLSIGEYEEIKKDALDPYAAVRDIYFQYRRSKIDK